MNKQQQDLMWSLIPKEIRKEIKRKYQRTYLESQTDLRPGTLRTLEDLYGEHNLTFSLEESCTSAKFHKNDVVCINDGKSTPYQGIIQEVVEYDDGFAYKIRGSERYIPEMYLESLKEATRKKLYVIEITGESSGSCTRELTDSEFKLIEGIFEECESEYCGGKIYEVPGDEEIEKIGKDIDIFQKKCIIHHKLQFQLINLYGYSNEVSCYVAYKLMDIYYKNKRIS